MVKVNELRVGNFIVDDEGALSKVIGFKPYEHSVRCDEEEGCDILIDIHGADGKIRSGYAVESSLVNPVPLTPEWLERCGWQVVDQGSGPYYWLEKQCWFHIHLSADGPLYANFNNNAVPIEYFHQLQNLYHILSGEELAITQPVS